MARIRRIIDRQGDQVMERVMAEAILTGELSSHLKKSTRIYQQRRNNLTSLLTKHLQREVAFDLPEGGMAVWLRFRQLELSELKPDFIHVGLSLDIDRYLAKKFNAFRFGFASLNETEQQNVVNKMVQAIKLHAS